MHRAILVDDEVFTRKGLMKLIDWEACGFRVVEEADDGEDALALIESVRPDVVITDIRMPVLDGLELIRQVQENGVAHPFFVIISGYDDFQYARQALRYGVQDFLLKPINEQEFSEALRRLNDRLLKQKQDKERETRLLPSALVEALIMEELDEETLRIWAERLHLNTDESLYYLFAENNDAAELFGREEGSQKENAHEIPPFKQRVEKALAEMTDGCLTFYLHEHRNRIGILLPARSLGSFGGSMRTFAEKVRIKLQTEQENERIFLYAGRPAEGLLRLADSYSSAKEALLYKYHEEESGLVILEEEKPLPPLSYIAINEVLYHEFLEKLEEQQLAPLDDTIERMFATFHIELFAPEAVKMAIHQCVIGVLRIVEGMEGDKSALSTLHPMLNWHDQNLTIGGLKRLFRQFAEESSLYLAELRKEQGNGGIQKIRAYIDAHYQENISLKSIARAFYLNPVYLGQLFKKTYGVYFNDYLLQLRIAAAKKLLRQTDRRIYEVAEQVGFGNADYFVTQFEKLEHLTPSEYRNRLKKDA
ncbi:response regulator transcription factor [Gorillibacterium timonense]|uniref:response regulator transcription factor n=1 Tax=Gorillibacterium timonense TaxID=1689269 RepID=UPI0009E8ED1E|nr:response regulator transcription factor [Gorillibacterium timonense]